MSSPGDTERPPTHQDGAVEHPPADCPDCPPHLNLTAEQHDWLVGIEESGVAGAVAAFDIVVDSRVGLEADGFREFAARHNGENPRAMADLASVIGWVQQLFDRG